MRATLSGFAGDPVGKFVCGETWAHYCADPMLWGVVLWGRPTGEHALALGRSLVLELKRPAVPHASVVDARQLQGGAPPVIETISRKPCRIAQDEIRAGKVKWLIPELPKTAVDSATEKLDKAFLPDA